MINNSIKVEPLKVSIEITKVCWLVDKNDLVTLKEIIITNYKVLGGMYYIIVPIFNNEIDNIFKNLISRYSPDIFISVGEINDTLKSYLRESFNPIKIIENFINEKDYFILYKSLKDHYFKEIKNEINYISKDFNNISYLKMIEVIYPKSATEILSTTFGAKILESIQSPIDFCMDHSYFKYFSQIINAKGTILSTVLEEPISPEIEKISQSLMDKETDKKLSLLIARIAYSNSINIITGKSDSVEDLCLYWNTRGISRLQNTVWIPLEEIDSDITTLIPIANLNSFRQWNNINLYSYSLNNKSMSALADNINEFISKHTQNFSVMINPSCPFMLQDMSFTIKEYMQDLIFNNNIARFIFAYPDYLDNFRYRELYSITHNLDFWNNSIPRTKETLPLICKETLSRISMGGLRTIVNHSSMMHITMPDTAEVIRLIFTTKGYTASISDKGIIANKIVSLLDGIEKCNIFKNKEIILLIKSLSKPNASYATIEQIKSFFDKEATLSIDSLIENSILFRGYLLKCKDCATENWIPIDTAKEDNICDGCLTNIRLPLEPQILYKLNSLITHGYNQGVITHIITYLNYIKNNKHSLFIPGIQVNELNRELDIVIVDNENILVGECKNDGGELKSAEIDSIIHIGNLLGASKIIFGSLLSNFTKAMKSKYSKHNNILFIDNN